MLNSFMNYVHDIRVQLETILANNPENDTLIKAALEHLSQLEGEMGSPSQSSLLALVSDLMHIQGQGLWGIVDEQNRLLDVLSQDLNRLKATGTSGPDFSITMAPSSESQRVPMVQVPALPPEILQQINEVYLLHSLATHPSKVLPPGKSLLSTFSSRSRHSGEARSQTLKTLKDQVSEVITRAFWDEALESLSSSPAAQLSRLRLLYTDLYAAVESLIPSSHHIMFILSNPLSPTSSPLRSAAGHLRVLLSVLRERCAPVRDAEIDELLQFLDDPPLNELPKACIAALRGIFDVAGRMKDDLSDLVIGTWTEQDARRWVRRKAIDSERQTVLKMFSAQMIKMSHMEWLGIGTEGSNREIVTRLMKSLDSSEPVSPFPPSNNLLPPTFMFTTFDVLHAQNLLQALVIAASLRSLVRPANPASDWLSRIWTLLELEVQKGGAEPSETKLLNLEDEVVQAAISPGDSDSSERLRESVRRILSPQDPVFMLLQSRLLNALQARLVEEGTSRFSAQVPTRMRSGLGRQMETETDKRPQERELLVKGFEDLVLKENIKALVAMVKDCLAWVEAAWGEFLHTDSNLTNYGTSI